jgi:hypothetical protein
MRQKEGLCLNHDFGLTAPRTGGNKSLFFIHHPVPGTLLQQT